MATVVIRIADLRQMGYVNDRNYRRTTKNLRMGYKTSMEVLGSTWFSISQEKDIPDPETSSGEQIRIRIDSFFYMLMR